jgi:hypothetical protein
MKIKDGVLRSSFIVFGNSTWKVIGVLTETKELQQPACLCKMEE